MKKNINAKIRKANAKCKEIIAAKKQELVKRMQIAIKALEDNENWLDAEDITDAYAGSRIDRDYLALAQKELNNTFEEIFDSLKIPAEFINEKYKSDLEKFHSRIFKK